MPRAAAIHRLFCSTDVCCSQMDRLVVLIADARDQLMELIPDAAPAGKDLRAEITEKLDTVRGQKFGPPLP